MRRSMIFTPSPSFLIPDDPSYPKAGTPETLIVSDPPVKYSFLFYHMKSTKVT